MRYSKTNIIQQHKEFLRLRGQTVSQEQLNIWAKMPLKYLAKILARERLNFN